MPEAVKIVEQADFFIKSGPPKRKLMRGLSVIITDEA
jgi:hypothetical protein